MTDNPNAQRKPRTPAEIRAEALAYLRSKWPDAEWSQVYGRIESEILIARKDEQGCAHCVATGEHLCRKGRGYITAVKRDDFYGRPVYTVCTQYCPHGIAGRAANVDFNTLVARSGLQPGQINQTFANYDISGADMSIRAAKALAMKAAQDGRWLVLAGQRGTGKTHLAVAIALETMKRGKQAYFWPVTDLLDSLRAGFKNGTYNAQMTALKQVSGVLVLDDWGKERTKEAGYELLYSLIDYRYRARLQTIFTTNAHDEKDIISWVDSRAVRYLSPILSRMAELRDWVTLQGPDWRVAARNRAGAGAEETAGTVTGEVQAGRVA